MKKLLSILLLVPALAFAAPGDKALLPTTAQAAAASSGKNVEGKMLIFGYVAGFVQGLQMSKAICTPAGKNAAQFNEEIVDIIIGSLTDPSVVKGDTLLILEISDVLRKNFPCATV